MLWDNIFEFFVKYVFGGYLSGQQYAGILGAYYNNTSHTWYQGYTSGVYDLNIISFHNGDLIYPLGNYLSLIATIISITIIVILCCLFIKKIISLMGKLFSGGTL